MNDRSRDSVSDKIKFHKSSHAKNTTNISTLFTFAWLTNNYDIEVYIFCHLYVYTPPDSWRGIRKYCRIYIPCGDGIENEIHVLFHCCKLDHIRELHRDYTRFELFQRKSLYKYLLLLISTNILHWQCTF